MIRQLQLYTSCVSYTTNQSRMIVSLFGLWFNVTTVFVDTRLWKTKPTETFPKFPSVLRVIDRSEIGNPPITATSVTF